MANYDKTILAGRLGGDPKINTLQSGDEVCNFSLAFTRGWGEKQKTIWCKVAVWGKRAAPCAKYLRKGSPVLVEGAVDVDQWEQNGEHRASLKLNAYRVEFLESKKDAEAAGRVAGSATAEAQQQGLDDDVPF